MLGLLFDRETGRLKDDSPLSRPPSVYADILVGAIRQICRAFSKVQLDCTPEREKAAMEGFISTELELSSKQVSDHFRDLFGRVSDLLWTGCLSGITLEDCRPKHGPGHTAEGLVGNRKYLWQYWHERLESYFPFLGTALPLGASLEKEFEKVTFLSPENELPVRVVSVPKTLKAPRIIAIEPSCMQFVQQGIRDTLYKRIAGWKLSAGHVNFRDQSINQRLALDASKTGEYATIDLSEASDRVPLDLAMRMFDCNPVLRDAILACRSTSALLPDGRVIGPLKKFASMGSALCFPVEAMYFYTSCVVASLRIQNLPIDFESIRKVTRGIYVYGDDIVVYRSHAVAVLDYLQEYLCKVNLKKSFWNGKFRESCGVDAYDGESVTPTYIRELPPKNRRQAERIISWIRTAGLFYKRGYWLTASYMYSTCEKFLGSLPWVSEECAGLGRISFLGGRSVERWNPTLHRLEVKAWVPEPVYRTDRLDDYAALAKALDSLELPDLVRETMDPNHLTRTARYGAVALKRRWVVA